MGPVYIPADYKIRKASATPSKKPKRRDDCIRAPHEWLWSEVPGDIYLVKEEQRVRIGVFPTDATVRPEIVTPFPTLAVEKSKLRSGKILQRPQAFDVTATDPATIPKLEEFLPSECFPDILEMHGLPELNSALSEPLVYKRTVPEPWVEHDPNNPLPKPRKSILHIWRRKGQGGHGTVFQATLSLVEPWTTIEGHTAVNVAVKLAAGDPEAKRQFEREVEAYSFLSRLRSNYLQQDWTGYVGCDSMLGHFDGCVRKGLQPTAAPLRAVVPKFFGSYQTTEKTSEASSLFLIEDCGGSFRQFRRDGHGRKVVNHVYQELFVQAPAMYASLYRAFYLQQSVKLDNVAIQPGPLYLPVAERSYQSPSFRIIDFGRARIRGAGSTDITMSKDEFKREAKDELKKALKLHSYLL